MGSRFPICVLYNCKLVLGTGQALGSSNPLPQTEMCKGGLCPALGSSSWVGTQCTPHCKEEGNKTTADPPTQFLHRPYAYLPAESKANSNSHTPFCTTLAWSWGLTTSTNPPFSPRLSHLLLSTCGGFKSAVKLL